VQNLKLDLITECRAARLLGLTQYTFRKLVKQGALPKPWRGSNMYSLRTLQQAVAEGYAEQEPATRKSAGRASAETRV
jgi:hypothetical protein